MSMSVPGDRSYTREHEWLRLSDDAATIGITGFAADAVFVQPPAIGASVTAGQPCGEIESTKSVSDLYSPASGEVIEVNTAVASKPSLVNTDPYGAGWLFTLHVTDLPELLDADAYRALTTEEGQ